MMPADLTVGTGAEQNRRTHGAGPAAVHCSQRGVRQGRNTGEYASHVHLTCAWLGKGGSGNGRRPRRSSISPWTRASLDLFRYTVVRPAGKAD